MSEQKELTRVQRAKLELIRVIRRRERAIGEHSRVPPFFLTRDAINDLMAAVWVEIQEELKRKGAA